MVRKEETSSAPREIQSEALRGEDRVGKPAILIVEDHEFVRISLREWLRAALPRFRCLEAKSGEEAVAMAIAGSPDIILMDIDLPGITGIEATRRIKATVPRIHVVMLTGHEDPDRRDDAIRAGASAYVSKGNIHRELTPVLAGLLSGPGDTGFGLMRDE